MTEQLPKREWGVIEDQGFYKGSCEEHGPFLLGILLDSCTKQQNVAKKARLCYNLAGCTALIF